MKATLYHVAHVCGCGQFISHSQGDFNTHKFHTGTMIDLVPLREREQDALAYGKELERRGRNELDERDTIYRGVMNCYAWGYFIGHMGEYVTTNEMARLNILTDIANDSTRRDYFRQRAGDMFQSVAWKIRHNLESLKLY